jgi:hypothetical protein
MDLFDQAVENPNAVAPLDKGPGQVAADEAGAAGDQDRLAHGRPGAARFRLGLMIAR